MLWFIIMKWKEKDACFYNKSESEKCALGHLSYIIKKFLEFWFIIV